MNPRKNVSTQTRNNWLLDASLFLSAVAASLSGIYFLYLPNSGYQGGRNPAYSLVLLFSRSGWDLVHTWSGVLMIAIGFGHLFYHWKWVVTMAKRTWRELLGNKSGMNSRARYNLWLNFTVALSFTLTSLSGIYFLFVGGSEGGRNPDPMLLFSRTTWDLIHTWAGTVLIIAAILHLVIHWRWVTKVTSKVLGYKNTAKTHTQPQTLETH